MTVLHREVRGYTRDAYRTHPREHVATGNIDARLAALVRGLAIGDLFTGRNFTEPFLPSARCVHSGSRERYSRPFEVLQSTSLSLHRVFPSLCHKTKNAFIYIYIFAFLLYSIRRINKIYIIIL